MGFSPQALAPIPYVCGRMVGEAGQVYLVVRSELPIFLPEGG